jgi:hypothetical protein
MLHGQKRKRGQTFPHSPFLIHNKNTATIIGSAPTFLKAALLEVAFVQFLHSYRITKSFSELDIKIENLVESLLQIFLQSFQGQRFLFLVTLICARKDALQH